MAIKTRAELKLYFVKNAIPTEGNFADLIDSQLNQAQDGVFRPEGEPLSVVAASGDQRRALRLYESYPSANPDWMISLNPRRDPGDPATSRPGFSITDGAGSPRLFIDKANGKVGVGTNDPQAMLDVDGGATIRGTLTVRGREDNAVLQFASANNKFAQIGLRDSNDQGVYVKTNAEYRLSVNQNGNVGIGVNQASAKLHVDGDVRIKNCRIEPRSGSIAIEQEDWQVPALLGNGWVNFGGPYNPVAYFKDSCGIVHLRGLIKGGALSTPSGEKPVFTLPAGYRPASQELHGTASSGSSTANPRTGRVDIMPDGKVFVVGGSNGWISLDGISFRAAS